MRPILIILSWLILHSVYSLAQSKMIAIPLKSVHSYLPDSYETIGTGIANYMAGYEQREFAPFKGIPDDLVEKKIRFYDLVRGQQNYEAYKKGRIKTQDWQVMVEQLRIDTTQLSPYPIKNRLNILVGRNRQERKIIIIDANNNQDFSDDQVLSYPITLEGRQLDEQGMYGYAIKPIVDSLPTVEVAVEVYTRGRVVNHHVRVQPNPYPYILRPTGPLDAQFYLSLTIYEHRRAVAALSGNARLFLVGSGRSVLYNTPMTEIRLIDPQAVSASKTTKYRIGQTLFWADHLVCLSRVTPLGDTLYLEDKGIVKQVIGFQEGFYTPPIIGATLDNNRYKVVQQPGEYLVLDFWGSWCGPCIAMIPRLKAFVTQYADKPVRLVSIARERTDDLTNLRRLITNHQLTWQQLWEFPLSTSSLVKDLAIEVFPTTLLIAPDGKILYRGTSEANFNELETRLSSELAKSDSNK
jgi:thiol-disulfide isomerase/thioredoxin